MSLSAWLRLSSFSSFSSALPPVQGLGSQPHHFPNSQVLCGVGDDSRGDPVRVPLLLLTGPALSIPAGLEDLEGKVLSQAAGPQQEAGKCEGVVVATASA